MSGSKYGHRPHNWFEAIVNKIGGEESAERFLRGELVVQMAEKFFPTWKIIKLGTGLKSADDFRKALKTAGYKIGDWANDILGKPAFTAATSEIELELVIVSDRDLGFSEAATRADIYTRAQSHGLSLCPAKVGPQLRLQYKDQPNGEWLLIAMEPIVDSGGNLDVFNVRRGGDGFWLSSNYDIPSNLWSPVIRWVFCRRK